MVDPADPPSRSDREEPASSTEVEGDEATATSDQMTRVYQPEPPLERLGKYGIQEQIGRGGMGVVWKAFDPDLRRTVAIKMLGEHLAHSPTARRRFQREARAAAAISHPHVLTIHSVEEDAGVPYLVMEYVRGQSLKEYVSSKGSLDPVEVIRLGCQIAQGLAAAHAQGVIHRDVKPGNVMLDEGATTARLTDFGLARVAFDNVELTSHDQCVGTLTYMSPESLRGERIDARSDLFSLGCVLYLMLSGYSPFQGRSQGEMLHKVLASTPPRLIDLNATIPPVLSDIVERLLQKSPDDRYQSAAEVADVLSRLQQQLNQAPTDEIATILATAPTTVINRAGRRSRTAWLTGAGVCVIGALLWWRLQPEPEEVPVVPAGDTGETATVDNTDPVAGDADPVVKLDRITVGPGPQAEFSTIAAAIRHANPGAVISVTGPGPYSDSVDIDGPQLNGLQLIADPRTVWSSSGTALTISNVDDVYVAGFDFDVDNASGRALHVTGATGNAVIDGCRFRHMLDRHSLSLVLVASKPLDNESTVMIRNCRFSSAEGPVMCLAAGSGDSAARIVCSNCLFTGPNTLVYVNDACRSLVMLHNIFIGGHNAINLSLKSWEPDSHVEIVNNTFVGTTYWIGLMDSFRSESLPDGPTASRVCNNLILGGRRMQGGDDQWGVALRAWTFSSNWWERDDGTLPDAGRGQVATLHDDLDVPVRDAVDDEDYLVPAADSPLLTSGAGGDLPEYIGARARPAPD